MSLSIAWDTRIITVPIAYLFEVSTDKYTLEVNQFRLDILDIMDSEIGVVHPDTHNHNTEVILGAITLARVIEFINGYTITFEDGAYIIDVYGANNNILDVVNHNQVSLRSSNSAGMIVSGSGVTQQDVDDIIDGVWDELTASHDSANTFGELLNILRKIETGRWKIDTSANTITLYDSNGTSPMYVFDLLDSVGAPSTSNVFERDPQ